MTTRSECECPECTADTGSPMWAYCDACAVYDCRERCWVAYNRARQEARYARPSAVDWDEPEYWRE